MGNCTVTGGNPVGCSQRGSAAGCSSAHGAAAALGPRRAGAGGVRAVMADSGRVVEFDPPVQAGDAQAGHPRHGVFRTGDVSSPPPCHERLRGGRPYCLLPLDRKRQAAAPGSRGSLNEGEGPPRRPAAPRADNPLAGSLEVLAPPMKGVWRIKLVISAEELAGILAERGNMEALIERMRLLASSRAEATATAAQAKQGAAHVRKAPPALPTAVSQAHCTSERMQYRFCRGEAAMIMTS